MDRRPSSNIKLQLCRPDPLEAPENRCHEDKGDGVLTEELHSCFQGSLQSPEQHYYSATTRLDYWGPQPAGSWLALLFPPHNCDVEVNPEEDVNDEHGDEGLGDKGDGSFSFQLQPDITAKHQANPLRNIK